APLVLFMDSPCGDFKSGCRLSFSARSKWVNSLAQMAPVVPRELPCLGKSNVLEGAKAIIPAFATGLKAHDPALCSARFHFEHEPVAVYVTAGCLEALQLDWVELRQL